MAFEPNTLQTAHQIDQFVFTIPDEFVYPSI